MTQPVKRFVLFMYDPYYPLGGWADKQGSYDTLEEAEKGIDETRKQCDFRYYSIVDLTTGEEVKTNDG